VVIIKPRRTDKNYGGEDWFHNALMNAENHRTYVLIRNGQNFYRIYSALQISEIFFPSPARMNKLVAEMDNEDGWPSDKEKAEDEILGYKRNILMLQGLLDRTQIFQPLKAGIMLTKPATYSDGSIRFIYDDEPSLTDGYISFEKWKKEVNSKIERGTRVFITPVRIGDWKYYRDKQRVPWLGLPPAGLYNVEQVKEEDKRWGHNEEIQILFMPGDKVWKRPTWRDEGGEFERKRREAFWIGRYSEYIINYDLLSLENIEHFIHDRFERRLYLEMLPVLYGLKRERLKEIEWEKGFVANLVLRLPHPDKARLEALVWQAVEWWKRKVIWKRPIMKEDAKALRMITSRVQRAIRGEI